MHREDAGLRKAEEIADHWHQRFLTLRGDYAGTESGEAELWNEMHCRAIGAKRVLDEIKAERQRLASGDEEPALHDPEDKDWLDEPIICDE